MTRTPLRTRRRETTRPTARRWTVAALLTAPIFFVALGARAKVTGPCTATRLDTFGSPERVLEEGVGGGYDVAAAGIDQSGEYVIERATRVTGSGSEDVTAAPIRSLGNDVIRVDAGEGIVLGDSGCRP